MRCAKRRRQRRHRLIGLGLIFVLAGLMAFAMVSFIRDAARPSLDARNCQESGTVALVAIVLDATDRLPDVTRQDLAGRLTEYLEHAVQFGQGVQLWQVSAEHPLTAETPVICRPVVPEESFTTNRDLALKVHKEEYLVPLTAAINAALEAPEQAVSPILETLQQVVLAAGASRYPRTRLVDIVLASDLAQHTAVSLEQSDLSFERFRRSSEYVALNPGDMRGIGVLVFQIQRRRHFDRADRLREFWRDLVQSDGGRFSLEPLAGQS